MTSSPSPLLNILTRSPSLRENETPNLVNEGSPAGKNKLSFSPFDGYVPGASREAIATVWVLSKTDPVIPVISSCPGVAVVVVVNWPEPLKETALLGSPEMRSPPPLKEKLKVSARAAWLAQLRIAANTTRRSFFTWFSEN